MILFHSVKVPNRNKEHRKCFSDAAKFGQALEINDEIVKNITTILSICKTVLELDKLEQ